MVVGVIALFVAVIVGVMCCRKNKTCCFAPEQEDDEFSQQQQQQPKSTKGTQTSEMASMTTSSVASSTTTQSQSSQVDTSSRSAVDLIEITGHGEALPPGWSKQQHTKTGEVFYVNQNEMISQRHSPIGGGGASNGW